MLKSKESVRFCFQLNKTTAEAATMLEHFQSRIKERQDKSHIKTIMIMVLFKENLFPRLLISDFKVKCLGTNRKSILGETLLRTSQVKFH